MEPAVVLFGSLAIGSTIGLIALLIYKYRIEHKEDKKV